MSRIGIGSNLQQPNKKCIGCKYWQSATSKDGFGFAICGKCTVGFCKKDAVSKRRISK